MFEAKDQKNIKKKFDELKGLQGSSEDRRIQEVFKTPSTGDFVEGFEGLEFDFQITVKDKGGNVARKKGEAFTITKPN